MQIKKAVRNLQVLVRAKSDFVKGGKGHGNDQLEQWVEDLECAMDGGSRKKFTPLLNLPSFARLKRQIGIAAATSNHPKVTQMQQVLDEHFTRYQKAGEHASTRAIVFANYRDEISGEMILVVLHALMQSCCAEMIHHS